MNAPDKPYIILPLHFERFDKNTTLAVNLAGEYIFLSNRDFDKFTSYSLNRSSDLYYSLKGKHFITNQLSDASISLLATKYRTKKSFLYEFTTLHMFVVSLRCNQKCSYCHASSVSSTDAKYDMSIETARKAVDLCLMSPAKSIKIEFQGGEPLLNFETVRFIVDYAGKKAAECGKNVQFVLCSNLTLADEEIFKCLAANDFCLSTSLDGPERIHDIHRRYQEGKGTYEDVIKALDKARKYMPSGRISALMTTTRHSLGDPQAIVDEYVSKGLNSIFLRALNPFGYARGVMENIGYSPSDFVDFYKRFLDYIVRVNLNGPFIEEAFTSLLLARILTPFSTGFVDLQFPAGTGISCVIYDYNGNVYPSDEARMLARSGDDKFRMGNVHQDSYAAFFGGPLLRNLIDQSCAEALPGCSACAFQMYCGIDPIRNYATQGDIVGHRPTSDFCSINKGIISHLFEIIHRNDTDYLDVFWSWLTGRHLSEIRLSS